MLEGGHHHSHEELAATGAHQHGAQAHDHQQGHELASSTHGAHGESGSSTHAGHVDGAQATHHHGAGGDLLAAALPSQGGHQHQHVAAGQPSHDHTGAGGGHGHSRGTPGHTHEKRHSVHSHGNGGSGGGHEHPAAGASGHDHGGQDPQTWSGTWESGRPAADGKPARGAAMVFRTPPDEQTNGPGHHDSGSCQPTAGQRTAADDLYHKTSAVLAKYKNNPVQAYADGFDYQFGPTDRMIHMINPGRVRDSTILDPNKIESFIYVMTDTGYEPVGGMYIMPEYGMKGPQPGGCITQWHHHGGLVGLAASGGTMNRTPEMLHVWTYPGLDPWAHYDGREMSQLWKPGSYAPSVCRESGDAMDGCLP
jgi:hypothetical protein